MIIREHMPQEELRAPFTKTVVDIERRVMAIGCELHIDCAEELLTDGSEMKNLWGINIYPDLHIDYISLINIRPQANNRSMRVESAEIREKIDAVMKNALSSV